MGLRPNVLLIQSDQLAAPFLRCYGNSVTRTPHIDRLAEEGMVFEQAYCNFPLCGPSRSSMMTGRLASSIGAFDNGADFPASVPTVAHYRPARGLSNRDQRQDALCRTRSAARLRGATDA